MTEAGASGRGGASAPAGGLEALVEAALAEDIGDGDRTTEWTVPPEARGRAVVRARARGVVAGIPAAERVFRGLDGSLEVRRAREDGEEVAPGEALLELRGGLRPILTGERTALNFLGRLSGIATLTARFVEAVRGTGCRITDTRKTTPGWRALEKGATRAGGAVGHRMGLYDMVLIKENHVRAAGGIGAALEAVRERAREAGLAVEVEVRSAEELEEALASPGARPDRILLDNMTVPALRDAVARVRRLPEPRPLLEASGGITLDSVRAAAETGVDLVSVGAITHSAPVLDLTLLVEEAG